MGFGGSGPAHFIECKNGVVSKLACTGPDGS